MTKNKILLLGYSSISKKRYINTFLKQKIKFSVASKSYKKRIKGVSEQYSNYDEAITNSDANIVFISLPNSLHFHWAKKALINGYHVVVDKPLSNKVKETKKLINIAKIANADFVKFQIFKADDLVTKKSPLALYQKKNIGKNISQYEMLKKLELSQKEHTLLIDYCKKKKINYLASVFDIESLNFLRKKSSSIKIPSGEITNYQLLKNIKKKKFFENIFIYRSE